MKFRALMKDPQYMRELQDIILTLSKLTKECVIRISDDKVSFIVNEATASSAPLVWVDIDTNLYFPEYTLKGINRQHPHIMLSVSTANLCLGLSMLRQDTQSCKLKLTHIQFPCLTIKADTNSEASEEVRQIVHDVPVDIIPRSDWSVYALPQLPLSELMLNVPSSRLIRPLIDRIKNLSPTIVFYVNSKAEMNIVGETDLATITTRYKNLEIRSMNLAEDDKAKAHIEASCSVDCKKMAIFFSALQVPTQEFSCGIDDQRLIHLEVNMRQGVAMHSILPAVCI